MSTAMDAAPESTLPYPPIHLGKKFVVLSDWDGTITTIDSNDLMTDTLGYGREKRRTANEDILAGRVGFRDAFHDMLKSVADNGHPYSECEEFLVNNIQLDKGFRDFCAYLKTHDIPFVIVSSGMGPLIRAVLVKLVGEALANEIDIIANDVAIAADGKWEIKYRHPSSGYGHDKSQAILPYRNLPEPPTLFFFGDGVSDISAARHADLLFAKSKPNDENDLAIYCENHNIRHLMFNNFAEALPVVASVVEGRQTVNEVLENGKA